MQTQNVAARAIAPVEFTLAQRIWPFPIVVFGLGLTAAWIGLLGYGLVRLTAPAIGALFGFVAF
jgi:hypothetical protein